MTRFQLDEVVTELYGAPRNEFVARRNELASQARTAGDNEAAATIAKLAKPTAAAWLANQLARSHEAEVATLVELGDELRDATARLDGTRLRQLSRQRGIAISSLVRSASTITGTPPSAAVTRELETVLATAVADAAVGARLMAGVLSSAKAAGDELDWPTGAARPRPVGVTTSDEPESASPAPPGKEPSAAAERLRRELAGARAAVKRAESERARLTEHAAAAREAAQEASARVATLAQQLHEAEQHHHDARQRAAAADRETKQADRAASRAWRRVQEAERVFEQSDT